MWHRCKNDEECKKLFRKIALKLHPDHGGSDDLMVLLSESYEQEIKIRKEMPQGSKKSYGKKMVYEPSEENILKTDKRIKILEEILIYASSHLKFKTDYTESVDEFLKENGYITSGQYNSLVKTYYAFRMHDKKEEK